MATQGQAIFFGPLMPCTDVMASCWAMGTESPTAPREVDLIPTWHLWQGLRLDGRLRPPLRPRGTSDSGRIDIELNPLELLGLSML